MKAWASRASFMPGTNLRAGYSLFCVTNSTQPIGSADAKLKMPMVRLRPGSVYIPSNMATWIWPTCRLRFHSFHSINARP